MTLAHTGQYLATCKLSRGAGGREEEGGGGRLKEEEKKRRKRERGMPGGAGDVNSSVW